MSADTLDTETLDSYRDALERVLNEWAEFLNTGLRSEPGAVSEVVFDRQRDRYLLVEAGWERGYRIHGTLLHVDVIDGKLWIQHDGTEERIAPELVAAGVPKDCIVLAFRAPRDAAINGVRRDVTPLMVSMAAGALPLSIMKEATE